MKTIAVIGAGISGLLLAKELNNIANVTVFEKARGVGGRMATRYAEPYQFDHGAQFFIAKSEPFKQFLAPFIADNTVARWDAAFAEYEGNKLLRTAQWNDTPPHYVAAPKMNQLCKMLMGDSNIHIQTRADEIKKSDEKWELIDQDNHTLGQFDWVISTAPAQQTATLMPKQFCHHDTVGNIRMTGCYSVMLGFDEPLDIPWQAAFVSEADISWISINSQKPGRSTPYSMLVHATNDWAEAHIEDDIKSVEAYLMAEVTKVTGVDVSHAVHKDTHKWRYANIGKQSGELSLIDTTHQLAACGDWCIHGRVEAAFTSAMHLAEQMRKSL